MHKISFYSGMEEDFFDFVAERERVRVKRESGAPEPWTEDPILAEGHFTNIDRRHDRGTRLMLSAFTRIDGRGHLVHAIMFYRLAGSNVDLLDLLTRDPSLWGDSLRERPFFNSDAYQRPCFPKGIGSGRRFLLDELPAAVGRVTQLVTGAETRTVKDLVPLVCDALCELGQNRYVFHVNEICKDLSYFFTTVDASDVEVGPGCRKGLTAMRTSLGALAKHPRNSLDANCLEHAVCEFRKYLEYKQGKPIKRKRRSLSVKT